MTVKLYPAVHNSFKLSTTSLLCLAHIYLHHEKVKVNELLVLPVRTGTVNVQKP